MAKVLQCAIQSIEIIKVCVNKFKKVELTNSVHTHSHAHAHAHTHLDSKHVVMITKMMLLDDNLTREKGEERFPRDQSARALARSLANF